MGGSLGRDAWLDLLARFVLTTTDTDSAERHGKKVTLFPRYHQWSAVLELVEHSRQHGPGHSYLVRGRERDRIIARRWAM